MLSPVDEEEVSAAIAGAEGALRVVGGGTRMIGKPAAGAGLSLAGLSGIALYEPGALTVVAQAGTPLAEIEAALAAENQRLPFEPSDMRGLLGRSGEPTIGGVVAANASGPRRIQAGACRDSLIGIRFVDGRGTVLKNGGRVMKNVTGYDLVKLMAGSYGTLGVLTEVAFKVLPGVEAQACVMIHGLSDVAAVAAMSKAFGSPFEVSGAAHSPAGEAGQPVTMLRLEGFADSVAYRAGKLRELLAGTGEITIEDDPDRVQTMWRDLRDLAPFHGRAGDVWRLSVKPSDGPGVAARAGGETLYDWGGGLVWVLVPAGTDLRARLGAFAGHATLIRASEETRARMPVFHPEPAPVAALSAGLRRQFDPKGILNPGVMG